MRTNLTQAQVTDIIERYFDDHGAAVNFVYYSVGDNGEFNGCLIDHDCVVPLPETNNV